MSPLLMMIPLRLMIGIRKPRNPIIGEVFSGEIEFAGSAIMRFKAGDAVYGLTRVFSWRLCGVQVHEGEEHEKGLFGHKTEK